MTIAPCHDEGHNAPSWLRITSPKCGATLRAADHDERDDEACARAEARRAAIMEAAELRRQARAAASRAAADARKIVVAKERAARHEYSLRMRAEKATVNKRRGLIARVRKSLAKPQDQRSTYSLAASIREGIERRRPAGTLTIAEAVVYMREHYQMGSPSGLHMAIAEGRLEVTRIDRYCFMAPASLDDYHNRSREARRMNGVKFNRASAAKHRGAA